MVVWGGVDFTVDGREPATAEEFYRIGLDCWNSEEYRSAAPFLLEHAALAGHRVAAELLGHVRYVRREYAAAVPWLRRSTGSRRAAYYLGCLYRQGCPTAGLARSYELAARCFRQAAALGEPEAMLALGDLYLDRLLPVSGPPADRAMECFLPAARTGHPYAQYRVAELLRDAYGDLERAVRFFELCLANPSRERHALGELMTRQSRTALGELRAELVLREQRRWRDAR